MLSFTRAVGRSARAASTAVFQRAASSAPGRTWTVLGAQWGDEGKGKLVDILAQDFDIVARCAGGSNAGHTVVVEGKKFAFHLLPSGVLSKRTTCVLGNGVVVHLPTLLKELAELDAKGVDYTGRLKISDRAHLVFDFHQVVDGLQEKGAGEGKIGTTLRGIGPAYSSKATRNGVRVGDLLHWESFEKKATGLCVALQRQYNFQHDINAELTRFRGLVDRIRPLITDTVSYLHNARNEGKSLLVEGANAALLDVDFGSYPYVTSSSTTIGGALTGLGIPPQAFGKTIGVAKAYLTRVGGGPFPTELNDQIGEGMRKRGGEFGVTTGRPRRCGWFDATAMRYGHMINGYSSVNITKLDVLSDLPEIKVAVGYKYKGSTLNTFPSSLQVLEQCEVVYETFRGWGVDISHARSFDQLPPNAQAYIKRLEEILEIPISSVGVGPGREALIKLRDE